MFVVIATTIAFVSRTTIKSDETSQNSNQVNENVDYDDISNIYIPEKYNYIINIEINEQKYQYNGQKDKQSENITKIVSEIKTDYKYEAEQYYKYIDEEYILTTKEDVYDVVNYNYLQLETINEYLLKSENSHERYLVYLKDIILGNNTDEYITIEIAKDKLTKKQNINVDYTLLDKNFNTYIEKYYIQIEIEEIE